MRFIDIFKMTDKAIVDLFDFLVFISTVQLFFNVPGWQNIDMLFFAYVRRLTDFKIV